jgi:exosortase B
MIDDRKPRFPEEKFKAPSRMPEAQSMSASQEQTNTIAERSRALPMFFSNMDALLIILVTLALYTPTYVKLSQEVWSQEGQGHGPVMLALTIWLTWQRWPLLLSAPKKPAIFAGSLCLISGLIFYTIGRSQEFPELEVGSQFLTIPGLLLLYFGWPTLKVMRFPILFLIFIVPLPFIVVNAITAPLKAAVSYTAEALLYHLEYPIGRTGVTLIIGQYKLLVADACAGLNSIFSLEAIGVFYLSVVGHTTKARNLLLAALIIPISFVSNVVRVITLVLITYYFGDAAGQGFVHSFAGILLFMIATALTIATDLFIGRFFFTDTSANIAPPTHHTTTKL